MSDELFDDIARQGLPAPATDDPPRYETANRTQVELTPTDLEGLLPPGHAARLVWRFVEGLDLRAFYAAIKAREGGPGRTPIDPKIVIALWLYATIDGVGSAREVDRLCYAHEAYRWLRGGVSVNHHTLSDFRVAHHAAIDDLLTQSIATLRHRGIVTLARVAHDGTRVRASAGAGSFRREGTLQERLKEARKLVERTARQQDGGLDRATAAQARAAAEGLARVEEALAQLPAVAEVKHRNGAKTEPRTSTTDPDARVMKMSDGGFRPAYNIQFATDVDSHAIVGVHVRTTGSDQQHLVPMLDQVEARVGRPHTWLADGGYLAYAAVEETARRHVTLLLPVPRRRGSDALVPAQPTDTPAVRAWRTRMATEAAKQVYRIRGATAERVHADLKTSRTLHGLGVRGVTKVHTWVLWIALAHNLMRTMAVVPHVMT
jgi:transposase